MARTNFAETEAAQAMLEIAEDRVAEGIRHLRDVTTEDGKPAKVTLELTITPNKARTQFGMAVKGKLMHSPRPAAESTIYADVNDDDQVEYAEYRQQDVLPGVAGR